MSVGIERLLCCCFRRNFFHNIEFFHHLVPNLAFRLQGNFYSDRESELSCFWESIWSINDSPKRRHIKFLCTRKSTVVIKVKYWGQWDQLKNQENWIPKFFEMPPSAFGIRFYCFVVFCYLLELGVKKSVRKCRGSENPTHWKSFILRGYFFA